MTKDVRLVLIAEDNIISSEILKAAVESLGHNAEIAANGNEAVALTKQYSFDLIFMDCQMPEMDGFEAVRIIRSNPNYKTGVPIVAVTSLTPTAALLERHEGLFDQWLTKPVSLKQLKMAFTEHLGTKYRVKTAKHLKELVAPIEGDADPVIDLSVLNILMKIGNQHGPDFVANLYKNYCHHAPRIIGEMARAVEESHRVKVAELAFKLKGMSANVGASSIVTLCRQLEKQPEKFQKQHVNEIMQNLTSELEKLNKMLADDSALRAIA